MPWPMCGLLPFGEPVLPIFTSDARRPDFGHVRQALSAPPGDVDLAVLPRCFQQTELEPAPTPVEVGAVEAINPALKRLQRRALIALVGPV